MRNANYTRGNGAAAALHIAALVATFCGASLVVTGVALVASLVVGRKGDIINNQIREIARLWLLSSLITVPLGLVMVSSAAGDGALVPFMAMIVIPIGILVTIMPLIAAWRLAQGYDYAYPLVFSPRRKAYVASKSRRTKDKN